LLKYDAHYLASIFIYSKPRLIRNRFDRRFYPVQAKIRINRRYFFVALRHFGTEISVRIL